jgi:3-methyladenine DNA glycosylase AlkD
MTVEQVVAHLRLLSSERAATLWKRWATDSKDTCLGVGITKLRAFAKSLPKSNSLALQLWDTGIHECKLLATFVADSSVLDSEQLNVLVAGVYTVDLSNFFVEYVVSKTNFLLEKSAEWTMDFQPEMMRRTGYQCVTKLALTSKMLDNNYFKKHLYIIEYEIKKAPNWVKEGQNNALIAIGQRNKLLNKDCIKVANKVGQIFVDYGESLRKTLDAKTILQSEKVQKKLI